MKFLDARLLKRYGSRQIPKHCWICPIEIAISGAVRYIFDVIINLFEVKTVWCYQEPELHADKNNVDVIREADSDSDSIFLVKFSRC